MDKKAVIKKYYERSSQMEDPYESLIFLWISFSSFLLSYYAKFTDSPSQALDNFSQEKKFSKVYKLVEKDVAFDSFEDFLRNHYDDTFI